MRLNTKLLYVASKYNIYTFFYLKYWNTLWNLCISKKIVLALDFIDFTFRIETEKT